MYDFLYYFVILALLAGAAVLAAYLIRGYQTGEMPTLQFFGPRPTPRVDVVESANVDGRRRLLLIRRDNVEHLIMTGGPVDVVIETGIGERRIPSAEPIEPPTAIYSRTPRKFGQVAGE